MPKYGGSALSGCVTARIMSPGSSVNAPQRPSSSLATPRSPAVSPGGGGGSFFFLHFRSLHSVCAVHGRRQQTEAFSGREMVRQGQDCMRHRLRMGKPPMLQGISSPPKPCCSKRFVQHLQTLCGAPPSGSSFDCAAPPAGCRRLRHTPTFVCFQATCMHQRMDYVLMHVLDTLILKHRS